MKKRTKKARKYNNDTVKGWIKQNYEIPTNFYFTGVALDRKGVWSKESHKAMQKLGFTNTFLEAISMEVIYKSHRIFQTWQQESEKQKRRRQELMNDEYTN